MFQRRLNALAFPVLSRIAMPRNSTPSAFSALDVAARAGASSRHGPHHEPHTLTTTVLPAKSASAILLPSRPGPARSGAGLRSAGSTLVIAPSPLTKPPVVWSADVLLHDASTTSSTSVAA